MIKISLFIGLILIASFTNAQTIKKQLKTEKYAGKYSIKNDNEYGPSGSVTIYPETDTTILFFIDITKGAPSYNLGQLYSRLEIENGKGIYNLKIYDDEIGCKWNVTIKNNILTIETVDNGYECGFGGNVYADNKYINEGNEKPEFFIDGHNNKIFFSKTKPENYLK